MPGSTTKRVYIERFDHEPVRGYVQPHRWLTPDGIELLDPNGNLIVLPYDDVKLVWFVRSWEDAVETPAERLYASRPRCLGLWVRFRFRDGDLLDAIIPNNLLELEPYGFLATPPHSRTGPQRVFIPRAALAESTVLGVIGTPLRRAKRAVPPLGQYPLFGEKTD